MKKEDKELLLKDLCARLPYGVKVFAKYVDGIEPKENKGRLALVDSNLVIAFIAEIEDTNSFTYVAVHEVKPYLLPLSSMTEEQKVIYGDLYYAVIRSLACDMQAALNELIDWLNKNHFDYRGLIEKGLALNASGLNIY